MPVIGIMRELDMKYVKRNTSPNASSPENYSSISGYENHCLNAVEYASFVMPSRMIASLTFQVMTLENNKITPIQMTLRFDPAQNPIEQRNIRNAFLADVLKHKAKSTPNFENNIEEMLSTGRSIAATLSAIDNGSIKNFTGLLRDPQKPLTLKSNSQEIITLTPSPE
jgi:hypothetical protein